MSLNASTQGLSNPCEAELASRDMRCANYVGFKARVGGGLAALLSEPGYELVDQAGADGAGDGLNTGLTAAEGPRLGLRLPGDRVGRDLGTGVASWYGPGFHGRRTANGERFNQEEMTAAHKTLPFGTRVLVHNPRTGKEVVVRINDRGPFVRGRVIDLSRAAARELGMKHVGHASVVLREVLPAKSSRKERVASQR